MTHQSNTATTTTTHSRVGICVHVCYHDPGVLLVSVPPEDFNKETSPYYGDMASPFARDATPLARATSPFLKDTTPFIPETPVPSAYYPRSYYTRPYSRSVTPSLQVPSYSYGEGLPLYANRLGPRRPYSDLYNPSPYIPISAVTRDPWWYDINGLRPYSSYPRYPSALRTSYLSPVKNRYLWTRHPMRYL